MAKQKVPYPPPSCPELTGRDLLLFDGECRFCRAQSDRLQRWAGHRLTTRPLQQEGLLEELGIPFDEAMLHWQPGPRPEDGVWAKHWYHNVHKSTGFEIYREKNEPFPPELLPLLEECKPHYALLAQVAIQAKGKS